jgi:hypothetical protein
MWLWEMVFVCGQFARSTSGKIDVKFLGILEIERKTDILAFAAFLISILSIGYNVKSFVQGSNAVLFPPASLVVAAVKYERGGPSYISLISSFSYSNKANKDYSSIIMNEVANFKIGSKTPALGWNAFVGATTDTSVLDLTGTIKPIFRNIAAPFVVTGGNGESHETLLTSQTIACRVNQDGCDEDYNFVKVTEFSREFVAVREEGGPSSVPFEVQLAAELIGQGVWRGAEREVVRCVIMIRLKDLADLEDDSIGYFARPCVNNLVNE